MSDERVRLTAVVRGRVQGVFFRYTARRNAAVLGLTGTVLNRPDASVEVVAEGPRHSLDDLLVWLRKGPPGARVESVEVSWGQATSEFESFEVRH